MELNKVEKELMKVLRKVKQKNVRFETAIRSILTSNITVRRKLNLLRHIFGVRR